MAVRHIVLPSGGWWELELTPKWGAVRRMRDAGENGMLAALTVAWSFPEPVTPDSIDEREIADVLVVATAINQEVLPFLPQPPGGNPQSFTKPSGTEK